jgi:hypothetical protein
MPVRSLPLKADRTKPAWNKQRLNFLQKRDLPADVDRDEFVAKGIAYLKAEASECQAI